MEFQRIGRGSYGDVYRPSCIDQGTGYVVKVMDSEYAIEETSLLEQIDAIDPTGIFHYPIVKNYPEEYKLKVCLDCSGRKKLRSCEHNSDKTTLLVFEDGGDSLDNFIDINDIPGISFKNVRNFYLGLWRLFFGVYVLHYNNCHHLDIKPANIMVRETRDECVVKLIDFGLFHTGKKLSAEVRSGKLDYLFDNYPYHPPEAILLKSSCCSDAVPMYYIYKTFKNGFENRLTVSNFYTKLKPYFSTQSLDMSRFDIDRQTYTTTCINSYYMMVDIRTLYTGIDIYMLGLSLKAVIATIKDSNLSDTDRMFTDELDELSSKMCTMYVGNRITPRQAFENYLQLVKDIYNVDMTERLNQAIRITPEHVEESSFL